MAFQFISTENKKNSPIMWKFENHDTIYQSDQERFERNVEFWRNKNGFPAIERVVTINGDFQPIEYTEFEDVKPNCEECKDNFDDCTCKDEYTEFEDLNELIKDEQPIPNEPAIESVIDIADAQSSISQDIEAPIDTPKRKPRKKTS